MGQSKTQRIADLEARLAEAEGEKAAASLVQQGVLRDLRVARAELDGFKTERNRQRRIAEHHAREAEREAERKRRDDLSNGIVDLSKIKHDVGFDFDHDAEGGTVTITLHASATEAKILAAYATERTKAAKPALLEAGTIKVGFVDRARIPTEVVAANLITNDFLGGRI
ncbi:MULTISPECIES: hypothetical protein [unclassified Microbacterium]|uniref:hypothetical protein n=1 Tax=unclassified Microbacterium TaxID=2609290 RepID=UPI0030195D93